MPAIESFPIKVLVVGYGNELRSDDGVGPWVVERLSERCKDPGVEFLACHQLLPEHAEPVSRSKRVIFIDAAADLPPGKMTCRRVRAETALKNVGHFFTPSGLLGMSEAVYGHGPEALVFAIGAESFEVGDSLTPNIRAVADRLCDRLAERIPLWIRKL